MYSVPSGACAMPSGRATASPGLRSGSLPANPCANTSNGRPSFAFFNPVFRIVALDGDAAHLQRLAGELRAKHPNLSMTLVNVRLP